MEKKKTNEWVGGVVKDGRWLFLHPKLGLLEKEDYSKQINIEKMKYTQEEIQAIAQAMQTYGGSFMKCIGMALERADQNNTVKILETWSEDVEKYYKFSKSH